MDETAKEGAQRRVEELAAERFPDGAVPEVVVLQYGDDPAVEPGEMVVRVLVPAAAEPEGESADPRRDPMDAFRGTHYEAIERFREDVGRELPEARLLEFVPDDPGSEPRFRMRIRIGSPPAERPGDLTPVMARLGPTDLQTLDTLITTGIAANRADAVRWALARIRERPAYEELRERARQIEELKTQF
jgi:hypothetical protein